MAKSSQLSLVGDLARKSDSDRFLAALLQPSGVREDIFALIALNAELAVIPERVSEPVMGQIRLQWWREQIGSLQTLRTYPHDVLSPLAELERRHGLSLADMLEPLLQAHERVVFPDPWRDEGELFDMAAQRIFPLWQVQARILGQAGVTDSCRSAARICGLVELLQLGRCAPFTEAEFPDMIARQKKEFPASSLGLDAGPVRLALRLAGLRLRQMRCAGFSRHHPAYYQSHPARGLVLAWAAAFG